MNTYRYKGKSSSGLDVEGLVDAFNEQEALARARENCRVLVSLEKVNKSKLNGIMHADMGSLLSGGKMKPKKLALLCSQLSIELKAGLPLVSCLHLAAVNEPDKQMKQMLKEVEDDVNAGNGLAESFSARGPFLPKTFIETVRAGEESGRLDECFERLRNYYERSASVSSKVGSALVYPALLLVVAIGVIVIIMLKAVPVFEESFASLGSDLPGPTKLVIGVSHFFTDNLLLIIAGLVALVLAIFLFRKTDTGGRFFAKLGLTFPGVGDVNRMNAASQFSSTLSTMLAAGLPLVKSARITADVANNLLIREDIRASAEGVVEGSRLSDGLKKSKWLPPMLLEMVGVGEETGKVEETLTVVDDYYTKEVHNAVDRALGILEPCIVIVMAVLVVVILLSVYLPLFSLYGSM